MANNIHSDVDPICPIPWTGIYFAPNGTIDSCCISKNQLGNANEVPIQHIVNNDNSKKVRQAFLDDSIPEGCSACSRTTGTYRNYMANKIKPYISDESLFESNSEFSITYADLRFRNTCNYACIYCGLYLSSTWGKELGKFVKSDESTIADTKNYLLEHVTDIKDIYLAGGEPLLIKENEEILQKFLESNPDVFISVNTNLSCITNNNIFDLLLRFSNVTWIISVDDTDERYNYMRYPGDWDQFYSNLLFFRSVIKETHIVTFNSVFCSVNAKSVFQMIDKIEAAGFQESYFGLGYVSSGPSIWLDPRHLPEHYLSEIIDFVKLKIQELDSKMLSETKKGMSRSTYQSIVDKLEDSNFNRDTQLLISGLQKLDDRRKLNSVEVFPELYSVINK